MSAHYQATFTSEPRNAAMARRSIASFASVCGFSETDVADIRLAAGEALSNAVEYGQSARSSAFSVRCSYEDRCLTIEIRDSGEGFDVPPSLEERVPDERGRGFGIFLMRRLMDRVEFTRQGTIVRLVRTQKDPAVPASDRLLRSSSEAG
ncbi:MAG: ATP-binding protein [Candidatus Eremiobacteraeota bacterium]|nr:ATP-binding protein [Candidatus Eremiobacteraeota bacterium]